MIDLLNRIDTKFKAHFLHEFIRRTTSEKHYMNKYIKIHVVKHRFVKKDKIQIWSDWYRKIINYKTSKRENQNIMENE